MKKTITFMLVLLMAGAAMSQGTFTCGEQISDVEGNTYETVEIGGLCWTKENMKSKTYADGSAIAKAMIYSSSMYPDTNANLATYGRLYTWFSAVNVPEGSSSKPTRNADGFVQGICPDGWHIPTVGEINKLNTNSTESLRSVELWLQPNNNTNSTGFSSLPAGYYTLTTNRFEVLLGYTYYWSDSSSTPEFAIACDVNYFCDVAKNEQKTTGDGVSVRCVKDASTAPNVVIDEKSCPEAKTVTDVDNNVYATVKIGNQCWMRQNLRVTKYANGTAIPAGGSNYSDTDPYYYDYTSSGIDLKDRGLLYNWSAANLVCPDGWHLPRFEEWATLWAFVGSQSTYTCGGNSDYIAKALADTTGWNENAGDCAVGNEQGNNNATGFSAVPAGLCNGSYFSNVSTSAYFWSSTRGGSNSNNAWYRGLFHDYASLYTGRHDNGLGSSVRCVKDNDAVIDEKSCPEAKTVTDVDNNAYATVKIGDQCWMRENLRVTKYANGTEIEAGGGNTSSTEPYYYEYPETETDIDLKDRGLLYNWSAANNVCPDGWHLPSDAEWGTMERVVSNDNGDWVNTAEWRGTHAGKLAGGDKWKSMSSGNVPGNMDYVERNASGFSAVAAGRCSGSLFSGASVDAFFWSSTQFGGIAWARVLSYGSASVGLYNYTKFDGFSVRCLKD